MANGYYIKSICSNCKYMVFFIILCDGPALFAQKPWGDLWSEAKVLESCMCIRGSLHLATSARWKDGFPLGLPLV